jgi:anti-sigma regulatory factor (Ser/Thr protein kinase)
VNAADTDEILLRVPARGDYARIVRIGGAALALRQGMTFAEIDDLRLAIDEAMIVLLDHDPSDDSDLRITYRITEGRFEFEAARDDGASVEESAVDRFDEIAATLVDDYDVDADRGWIRIRKTRAEED